MSKSGIPVPAGAPDSQNLPLLLQLAEIANSSLDLDKVLERIGHLMREIIDCEMLAILLLDESAGELRVRYAIGLSDDLVHVLRIPVGKGITGKAAEERQPVLSNDVLADGRYLPGSADVRSELAVPLVIRNRVVGVIDLQSIRPGYFTEHHRDLAVLAAARVAAAVQNARLYRSTLRQAHILQTLTDISREFSGILQLNDLLRKIAELIRQLIPYDAFSVLLLDDRERVLKGYLSMRASEEFKAKIRVPYGTGIVGDAAAQNKSVVVANVLKDPRYIPLNEATRSEMAVPLVVRDRVIGVLDLESIRRNFFTPRHLQMMEVLAPQVAIAIENARLYEKLAQEERRLERDLTAARELQLSLLPPCCPEVPGFQLSARYEPARELGGDLYDFIHYEPKDGAGSALGIFAGDVSGKGTAAALYAALAHGLIRTLAQRRQPAAELTRKLNKVLCERRVEARSLAICFAILDLNEKKLEIANAGLPRPLFCRDGEITTLPVDGVPLGLLENIEYEAHKVELREGDTVVFYSDGISENFNSAHEEYGRVRLRELIRRNCHLPAGEMLDAIFREMDHWSDGLEPSDDRTVVVLKVGERGGCERGCE